MNPRQREREVSTCVCMSQRFRGHGSSTVLAAGFSTKCIMQEPCLDARILTRSMSHSALVLYVLFEERQYQKQTKGPCTQIVHEAALKYTYRYHFEVKACIMWVDGPVGYHSRLPEV